MSNFQVPLPCQNCLRFHYGYCREAPKECWRCHNYNHIERYCPHRRRRWPRGEALPGSRPWCEYHGLDADPLLRSKVLNSLKVSPNCNIWIDEELIYRGCVEYRFNREEMRGRPLNERMTRRRSRSPMRDFGVRGQRSRSPIRRRSPSPDSRHFRPQQQSSSNNAQRGRSRSLLRQRYSPTHTSTRPRGRSPVFFGSNAVVFDANNARRDLPQPKFGQSATPYVEPQVPNVLQGVNLFRPFLQENAPVAQQQAAPARQGSQSITSMASSKTMGFGPAIRPPLAQTSGNAAPQNSGSSNNFGQVQQSQPQTTCPPEPEVEDPHFVLGVRREALEAEIIEAYQKRMWEVEIERRADVGYTTAPGTNNVWDESVAILRAAKKKLVGY